MKPLNPMLTLRTVFKGNQFRIEPPQKTRGTPTVTIMLLDGQYLITFSLRKLVKGQTFLGLYPTAANLPSADNLKIGDYALLASGEVIQIGA